MYTVDSSFLSSPTGMRMAWVRAIAAHNPDEADEIVAEYFNAGGEIGINADLALAQGCHECAWFTSRRWREQRNPCGLAVTSDDAPGVTFDSIGHGVQAHYEHLVCYTMREDPPIVREWGLRDPRHTFFDGRPAVRDLIRPDRKWAVPGDGYVGAIVAIANQVVGQEGSTVVTLPTSTDIGYAVRWHESADLGPPRRLADVTLLVMHDTEGHMIGDEAVLTSAAPPVESAHVLIDRDGTLVMMVPLERTAWTPGNDVVAQASINIELSGFRTVPYTEDQYRSAAAFTRWCIAQGCPIPMEYIGRIDAQGGPMPDKAGMLGHQDVPNPDVSGPLDPGNEAQWGGVALHRDPGPLFDWPKFLALVKGDAHPTQSAYFADGNPLGKIPMLVPFQNRWSALNDRGLALPMMGWPKLPEQTIAGGRRVQRFERGWYGTQQASDPWDVVQLPPEEAAALGLAA